MKNEDPIVEDSEPVKGSNVTTKGMHLAIREDFDVNVDDVHKATAQTKPRTILMSQVIKTPYSFKGKNHTIHIKG